VSRHRDLTQSQLTLGIGNRVFTSSHRTHPASLTLSVLLDLLIHCPHCVLSSFLPALMLFSCPPLRARTHARAHTRTRTRARTHVHTRTQARTHAHTHTQARTHAHTHTRTHTRAHTCTRAHTHAHTYTRAHTLPCLAPATPYEASPLLSSESTSSPPPHPLLAAASILTKYFKTHTCVPSGTLSYRSLPMFAERLKGSPQVQGDPRDTM
jgi:hypothetical protein